MARIYARGSSSILRSAEVKQDDVDSIIEEYINCVRTVDSTYNVEISRNLDSLKDNHQDMEIKASDNEVRIGYQSHDCWITISRYNISKEKWIDNNINKKSCIFDQSLLVINIDHLNKYDSYRDFSRNEFYKDDGDYWIEWFKNTEDMDWLDPMRDDFN